MNRGMGDLKICGGTRQGAGISQVVVGSDGVKKMGSQGGTEGATGRNRTCRWGSSTKRAAGEHPNGENRLGTMNKD